MATTTSKIPTEMTAMRLHEYGGPEVFQADTVPTPEYGPRDVLIKVSAVSINGWDSRLRRGHAPQLPGRSPIELPLQPGREMAGEVVAAGDQVTQWETGDRVVLMSNPSCGECELCRGGDRNLCIRVDAPGHAGTGTYAQYVAIHESWLLRTPDELSDEEAAGTLWAYGNSLHAVNVGGIGLGSTVAVTAASSAMGIACMQLSKIKGAKTVIGLSTSPDKAERILGAGADHVVDISGNGPLEKIRAIAGGPPLGGVDVVLDNYGSQALMDMSIMMSALKGRIVMIATNSESFGDKVGIPAQIMLGKHLSVLATRSALHEEQVQVLELAAAGRVKMPIQEVFELEDMTRAHELLDSGKHVGKIVLRA